MTEADHELATNPGVILKAAREELKLSVDSVAHDLHLRSSVVVAMEAEDYDSFSSDVFLKGYFRSYCRLVRLHEERMVELLENKLSSRQQKIDDSALVEKKARQAKSRKKLSVLLILLALIACTIYFVFTRIFPSHAIETEQLSNVSLTPGSVVVGTSTTEESDLTPATNVAQTNIATATVETIAVDSPSTSKVDESQTPVAKVEANKVINSIDEIDVVQENEENQEKAATGDIQLTFNGDCWFKLRNGAGKNIFAALKNAGDTLNYSGPLPFQIILGDAAKAEIVFDSKSIDLRPYTAKNGRAAITLSKDSM